jgi:predicted phosphodiesterase
MSIDAAWKYHIKKNGYITRDAFRALAMLPGPNPATTAGLTKVLKTVYPSSDTGDLKRLLIIPDCHHPYVDVKAWKVMLRAARQFKPQIMVTLGDFGDYYCTSRHPKDPNRSRDLQFEVDANNAALDELDELGVKDKRFIAGNHEYNLSKYLMEKAPELFNMVKVEKLLRLKERGWAYTPYHDYTRVGKLYLTHDTGASGANAHTKASNDFGSNAVIGHTHRMSTNYSTTITGKAHLAAMLGWLGDREKAEYMYKANTRHWSLGFGTGYMESNGTIHITPIPIIDYRCILEGRLITL